MRFVGLALGVVLVGAGAFLLVSGLRQVLDFPIGACFGPDCFDLSAAFVTLPAAIFSLVIGGIVLTASVSAIQRSNPDALGGLSALTALGAVFDVMGAAFLFVEMTTSSIVSGTFLFMGITFLLVGGLLVGIDLWLAARRRRASRLRAAGMRGVATIVSVSDSNVTINNDPMVNLQLRVSVPNHPPYDVTKRQVISRIAVGQFVPGAVLPVLVDPADPTDVMIDDAGGGAWATGGTGVPGTVVRLGAADSGIPNAATALDPQGSLSPDLMATVSDALSRAADQFAAGDPGSAGAGVAATTITVNGQTFQVPGGAGQTVVVTPGGEILMGAAAVAAAGAAAAAGATVGAGQAPSVASGPVPASPLAPSPPAVPAPPAPPATSPSPVGSANGRVSIESLTDTGTQLGDMRLFSFEFSVSPAGGMPYRLSHAALVPTAQVPRLIPGASFPAIIDANLPGGLGIFWDR